MMVTLVSRIATDNSPDHDGLSMANSVNKPHDSKPDTARKGIFAALTFVGAVACIGHLCIHTAE